MEFKGIVKKYKQLNELLHKRKKYNFIMPRCLFIDITDMVSCLGEFLLKK